MAKLVNMKKPMIRQFGQFWLALSFLTRIPVPKRLNFEGLTLAQAAWAFPLVGGLAGVITAGVYVAMISLGIMHGIAAWIAFAAQLLLTGGLHEDGLADMADGLAHGRDREAKLAIMRDSRIGVYGVLALMIVVTLRTKSMAQFGGNAWWFFIAAAAGSRACMVVLMYCLPHARKEGLAASAGKPGAYTTLMALLLGTAPLLMLGAWQLSAACLCAAIITCFIIARIAIRHFGGITGDVLGAAQQITEVMMLVILSSQRLI